MTRRTEQGKMLHLQNDKWAYNTYAQVSFSCFDAKSFLCNLKRRTTMKNTEVSLIELLTELQPEELEPRLELQVLVDPLAGFSDSATDVNCGQGGNCNIKPT